MNETSDPLLLYYIIGSGIILLFLAFWIYSLYATIKKQQEYVEKTSIKIAKNIEFNTTLSHELRTPLYAVTAICKNLLESSPK